MQFKNFDCRAGCWRPFPPVCPPPNPDESALLSVTQTGRQTNRQTCDLYSGVRKELQVTQTKQLSSGDLVLTHSHRRVPDGILKPLVTSKRQSESVSFLPNFIEIPESWSSPSTVIFLNNKGDLTALFSNIPAAYKSRLFFYKRV